MQILETITSTSRGRRGVFAQKSDLPKTQGRGANRWMIYKQLCVAKSTFGLNDRCLAVLSSLLSFLPEDEMNEKNGLIVFPSNRQLSLRAHGMPESTLRRHLASLIEAGIIARKDSPTRKRYAHKDREGGVELAFGFSFAPLLERASEIARTAEAILADQKALKRLRDEVSVVRREIALAFSDNTDVSGDVSEGLQALFVRFRTIVDAIPRRPSLNELTSIKANLDVVRDELSIALKNMENTLEMSGSVAQSERQHIESLTESHIDSKVQNKNDFLISEESEVIAKTETPIPSEKRPSVPVVPLDMVLNACPDIIDYAPDGIRSWRDFIETSKKVSQFLGIGSSAYGDAIKTMGLENGSTLIAWLLQRIATIQSAGGYLQSLTNKARTGGLSISALLMNGLKQHSTVGCRV